MHVVSDYLKYQRSAYGSTRKQNVSQGTDDWLTRFFGLFNKGVHFKNCVRLQLKTCASELGLTYTPGQCHRLRQANFLHQTLM